MRLKLWMAFAVLACVGTFAACDDSKNDNPGVPPPCMVECGGGAGGDGGSGGGGVVDAGPPGPALYIGSTKAGAEALQWLDLNTDRISRVGFKGLLNDAGLPGSPVGIAVDAARLRVAVSLGTPASIAVLDPAGAKVLYSVDAGFAAGDQLSRLTATSDRTAFYVANASGMAIHKVNFATRKVVASATSAGTPELVMPTEISLANSGELMVGSMNAAVTRFQVFEDRDAGFSHQEAKSQLLKEGASQGTMPCRCAQVPGASYLYCSVGGGNPSAGIWKVSLTAPPKLVISGLVMPGAVAVSPLGQQLFVADGSSVHAYWIAGALADAPAFIGSVVAPSAVYDLAVTADGQWAFATVPAADQLLKIRSLDFKVIKTYSGLSNPGPMQLVP